MDPVTQLRATARRGRRRPARRRPAAPARASTAPSGPTSATTRPTPRCCSRRRSASRRGRSPSGWARRSGERLGSAVERVEVAGPGLPQPVHGGRLVRRRRSRTCVAAGDAFGAGTARAAGARQRRVREREPDRADRRRAGPPRRLRRLALPAAGAGRPRRSSASTTSTTRASQVLRFGESIKARARGEEPPEDGYHGDYVARSGAAHRGRRRRRPRDARAARRRADGRGDLARRSSASGVHMDRFSSERALHEAGDVERAFERARPGLRARGRDLAAHDRARRRQGPRAAALDGRGHLLRLGHRLPPGQARARLRPRDRHLGRRPPRLHRARARRLGGARRRPGALRDRDHAARQPQRGRPAREDVQARRRRS